ncbi:MAG: lipoyl(octanoyl) transferase LipB [Christensenellales bacterium]|jgi:lipoyl(octanoyl) transferase
MGLNVVFAGTLPYGEALDIQYKLFDKRVKGEIGNTLLLLEHPPVLTMGGRGEDKHIFLSESQLKERGIEIFRIDRGGDVTYHGPGQLVGYIIYNMYDIDRDVRLFIRKIENTFINLLRDHFSLEAVGEIGKHTGVWIDGEKITAIGISVRQWVSMHGFAFNVNTDLRHFDWINPCGLSMGVTSVEKLTGRPAQMEKMFSLTAEYFAKELGEELLERELTELI